MNQQLHDEYHQLLLKEATLKDFLNQQTTAPTLSNVRIELLYNQLDELQHRMFHLRYNNLTNKELPMTNYSQLIELAKELITQSEAYTNRPTKAESARIRKSMNEIKKLVTPAKQDLLYADKA